MASSNDMSHADRRLRDSGGYVRSGSPSESAGQDRAAKVKFGQGPASAHELPEERIFEFSDGRGSGGLLSLRRRDDGTVDVEVYRSYGKVRVLTDAPVIAAKVSDEVAQVEQPTLTLLTAEQMQVVADALGDAWAYRVGEEDPNDREGMEDGDREGMERFEALSAELGITLA